jgi:uncharacterized protein with HEPN domain
VKEDRIYLLHIRDAITRIRTYTSDGRDSFFAESITQDAVIRNLEIIGEAVKNLSSEATEEHGSIPWKQIAGMRDKLIHHYFGVDLRLVWDVIDSQLDELSAAIEAMMEDDGDDV